LLKSGKVEMDERDGLTDEEIKEGFVLTCQSHPLTDDVYVDYDI
jgi:ring-1,2-phenylacetyl-CoA epoxidase subunit PaaE